MTSPAVKAWTSFLLAALTLYGSFTIWKVYKAHSIASTNDREQAATSISAALTPLPLEKFSFVDSDGEPFAMEKLAGKAWVASYFFATCPGFCLQMNQEIAKITRDLADEDVTFVSFTVDPENDTPAELKAYAERMRADPRRWVFLTGEKEDIQELGQQYLKMPATKEHNDKLVLVGRDARVQGFFSSRDTGAVKKLKRRIKETRGERGEGEEGEETRGQGDKETRGAGGKGHVRLAWPDSPCPLVPLSPCHVTSLSPCPLVPLSPCLRGSAAEVWR